MMLKRRRALWLRLSQDEGLAVAVLAAATSPLAPMAMPESIQALAAQGATGLAIGSTHIHGFRCDRVVSCARGRSFPARALGWARSSS